MRLQPGDMAKVQADIVAGAMLELVCMDAKIEELQNKIAGLEEIDVALAELRKRGATHPAEGNDD